MSLWQEEHFLQPAILGGLIRLRALRDESWRGRKSVFERLSGVLDAVSGELTLVHEQSAFADVIVIVGVEIEDDLGHLLLDIMELVRGLPRVEVFFELRLLEFRRGCSITALLYLVSDRVSGGGLEVRGLLERGSDVNGGKNDRRLHFLHDIGTCLCFTVDDSIRKIIKNQIVMSDNDSGING